LKISFDKSHGSYLNIGGINYLDFWSFYSTIPLGYNHPAFDAEFKDEIAQYTIHKFGMGNGLYTDEECEYKKMLLSTAPEFDSVWLASSGSLAIDTAYRVARYVTGHVGCLCDSFAFHGIHGLSNYFSAKPDSRLMFHTNPFVTHADLAKPTDKLNSLLACVITEPFRSTHGDHTPLDVNLLKWIRAYCTEKQIPLIFDEIQTGFGATGTMWYYQQLGVVPDILVFGKKAQAIGVMVNKKYSYPLEDSPDHFSGTFNGDMIDLIRMKYVLRAIRRDNLLNLVNYHSSALKEEIEGMRGVGYLLAYPVTDAEQSLHAFLKKRFLANRIGCEYVKLRPNLALTEDEMVDAIAIMKKGGK